MDYAEDSGMDLRSFLCFVAILAMVVSLVTIDQKQYDKLVKMPTMMVKATATGQSIDSLMQDGLSAEAFRKTAVSSRFQAFKTINGTTTIFQGIEYQIPTDKYRRWK